jgi:F-type H+-transporting ATPase subunit a
MANPVLHIKDGYYFEIPKMLWRSRHETKSDFPDWWVRLDDDFQKQEAGAIIERIVRTLTSSGEYGLPETDQELEDFKDKLIVEYEHWKHSGTKDKHPNAGKPFDVYLESERTDLIANVAPSKWQEIREEAGGQPAVATYKKSDADWSDKIDGYNQHLHGKILIPQPFGEIKNLHESEIGFCISKFMVLELVIAFCMVGTFTWLGRRMRNGDRPRGRAWNFFEAFLVFLRDDIAYPVFGKKDGDKFLPLLWTIFLFILGCNLLGMIPWLGAPTGAFGVTVALAVIILATGMMIGSFRLKPFFIGYWLNLMPQMELPTLMAIIIKPMLMAIELLGLFIKHGVLAVRLLANMVAGHLVLLGIMGIALTFADSGGWYIAAPISILAATLFSCLELFVALLQAYVFTFLAALFLNAAIHHH